MSRLPTGTVSLLFSDIEGSTQLVHRLGLNYAEALAVHRSLLRQAWEAHNGVEMGTEGDSFYVAFSAALDAVAAAIQGQRAVQAQQWPQGVSVRVRMGIHTGSPGLSEGAYVGLDVHRAARIAAAAHGGQVVVSAATAELVRPELPASVRLVDLGSFRLKDLPRAEHLLQVQAEDLQSGFPALRTLGASSRLPVPSTPLVGRDGEAAEIVRVLMEDGARLLTLSGPGGSGKTRLALDVALRLSDRFPDGAYFTALDAATTAEEMETAIAQALDIAPDSASSGTPWAEASELNGLLVLDSLEQVAGAREALARLMSHAPRIVVIVTSQRPIHIAGEHEYSVPPLELPPDGAGLETAARSAAVEMFIRQARLVRPSFAATDENIADVVAICRRLDGLPLALELAAAQTRLLTPHAILQRLGGALDLASRVHVATRQHTLRSTIGWSYNLLGPNLQGHFRRMGVFAGGADLNAVAAVMTEAGDQVLDPFDLLDELLDVSAVRIMETTDGEPRASMLQTLRSFALDELRARGELDQVRERHARHYLATAQSVGELSSGFGVGPLSDLRGRSWFEIEDANLREAVAWALASGAELSPDRRRLALKLCAASGAWWTSRAAVERASWLQRAVDLAVSPEEPALAQCLFWLSALLRVAGDWDDAQKPARACLDLSRRLGDPALLAPALANLARFEMFSGRASEASQLLQEGIEIANVSGDRRYILEATIQQAIIEDLNGHHERSIERNTEALALAKELGDEPSAIVARHNAAYSLLLMGRSSEAEEQMRHLIPDYLVATKALDLLPVAEDYAAMLVAVHDEVQAALLLGAAEGLRSQFGIPVAVHQREMVEAAMNSGSQTLGPEEWEREYRRGERADIADALAAAATRALAP